MWNYCYSTKSGDQKVTLGSTNSVDWEYVEKNRGYRSKSEKEELSDMFCRTSRGFNAITSVSTS